MSQRDAPPAGSSQDAPGLFNAGRGLWVPLIALGLLVAVVAWSWIGFVLREREAYHAQTLDAVAELKAQQLGDWLDLHLRSTNGIGSATYLAELYERWRVSGDAEAGTLLSSRLEQLAHAGRVEAVVLADGDGRVLWSNLERHAAVNAATRADWVEAAAGDSAALVGPYLDDAGQLHLDFVVALPVSPAGLRSIVILHRGQADYLPARFADFPLPLASGTISLVREEGGELVPLGAPRAGTGGREWLTSVQPVPGTDWSVLASVETAEVRRESLGEVLWITLLGGMLFLASGAVLIVLRQRRRLAEMQARERERDDQLRAFHLLHAVADSSDDPIFVKDLEGRYTLVNRACCEFLGRAESEILGRTDHELFPPEQAEELARIHQGVLDTQARSVSREVLDSTRGQRIIKAIKGPLRGPEGRLVGVFGIARDVTEQETSELALEAHSLELEHRNRELERFNEAMVGRELDMLRLKHEVNELCAQLGLEPRYGRELIRVGRDVGAGEERS